MNYGAAACCCTALFTSSIVQADEFFDPPAATLPSNVTLEGGGDALGSRDFTTSVDLDLRSGNRIRAGYTSAQTIAESLDMHSDTYSIGLNSDPLSTWSYGMSYETMARDDNVTSDAIRGNIKLRHAPWRFALYPELRYLTLSGNKSDLNTGIRNPGIGAAITYSGLSAWSFTLKRFMYQYSSSSESLASLTALRRRTLTRIGRITARVGQELNASQSGLSVDFAQNWGGATLEWMRSISAIDHEKSRELSFSLYWDVTRAWSLFARFGRSSSANLDPVGFASGGVTFMWGEGL